MWDSTENKNFANKVINNDKQFIQFLSAEEKVGKTFLLVNLAKVLIEEFGCRVCYVDFNKRNEFDHDKLMDKYELFDNEYFGFEEADIDDWSEVVERIQTSNEYDYVLMDTSPINVLNRNNIHPYQLKSIDSLKIIVINKNSTKIKSLKDAWKSGTQAKIKFDHLLFNDCPIKAGSIIEFENNKKRAIHEISRINKKLKIKAKYLKTKIEEMMRWMKI